MWKPKVKKERCGWHVVGGQRCFASWREAYAEARRAAARFAGREVPC